MFIQVTHLVKPNSPNMGGAGCHVKVKLDMTNEKSVIPKINQVDRGLNTVVEKANVCWSIYSNILCSDLWLYVK